MFLMPVSSLPGPYGIGGFGWNAYDFVDFLASCKQHYWQILPPYDNELWRLALSVVLGPCGQPQFHRLCRAYRGRVSGAARYRRRVPGIRPQAMSTTVLSLAAAVRFLDRAAERFAADKPADFDDFIQANEDWLIPLLRVHDRQRGVRSQGVLGVARRTAHPRRSICQSLRRPSRAHALPPDDAVLLQPPVEPPQGPMPTSAISFIIGDLPIYVSRDLSRCGPRPSSLRSTPPAIL